MSDEAWEARAGCCRCGVSKCCPSRRSAQSSRAASAAAWRERKTRRAAGRPEEWTLRMAGDGDGDGDGRLATRATTSVAVGTEKSGP
jgi:hypothetical protein